MKNYLKNKKYEDLKPVKEKKESVSNRILATDAEKMAMIEMFRRGYTPTEVKKVLKRINNKVVDTTSEELPKTGSRLSFSIKEIKEVYVDWRTALTELKELKEKKVK